MAVTVGSVRILLDVDTGRMSRFSSAASTVARESSRMRTAAVTAGNEIAQSFNKAGQAAAVFTGHLGGFGARLRGVGQVLGSVDGTVAALGVSLAGAAVGLTAFVQSADRMRRMENDLRTVTTSTANLRDVQKSLFDISQDSRAAIDGSVTLYARMARAADGLGFSQKNLLRITQTVQKSFAIGGASPQEAAGAAVQLAQGIASNRFSGDEFRSVSENAPVLLRAMADQLGVTIGKLREMAHAGELTGEVVMKAILNSGSAIDKQFGKTVPTVAQGFTKLKNSLDEYVYNTDKAYGITSTLSGALVSLADNFEDVAYWGGIVGKVLGGALIGRLLVSSGRGIGGLFSLEGAREKVAQLKEQTAELRKQSSEIYKQIKITKLDSDQRLISLRQNQIDALKATKGKETAAEEKLNGLVKERVGLNNKLAAAKSGIVAALKQEQQESLAALKNQQLAYNNASRSFRASPSADSLDKQIAAYGELQAAKDKYESSKVRTSLAASGEFDEAALKRYGAEMSSINKELASNHKAQISASQQLLKAQQNYVAAQSMSPAIAAKARAEIEKTEKVLSGLRNEANLLAKSHLEAVGNLEKAVQQTTLLGAAAARVRGFFRGLWGLIGGGPGAALSAALITWGLIESSINNSKQATDEWKESLREAGLLADDVANSAAKIDEAVETKNLSKLRELLRQNNEEMQKLKEGGFWTSLLPGFLSSERGIDQISRDVGEKLATAQLSAQEFTSGGFKAPAQFTDAIADYQKFIDILNAVKEANGITAEQNDELQSLANKHSDLDPLLNELREITKIIEAGAQNADRLNKALEAAGAGDPPAWIQDQMFQDEGTKKAAEVRKQLGELEKKRLHTSGLTPEQKEIEDRTKAIIKAAEKEKIAITDVYKAEAEAQAKREIAAEKAMKQAEGLKDLRLDALAGQMDEWNQKIVQTARSLGVTREELEAYINAVTSGDLSKVPAVFKDIAKAMEQASENSLLKSLKDVKLDSAVSGLSDLDKQLVEIAKSSGMSYENIKALVDALQSGDFTGISKTLTDLKAALQSAAEAKLHQDNLFERSQLFRNETDREIASRLKGAGLPVDFTTRAAQEIRDNLEWQKLSDSVHSFVSDFREELINSGGNVGKALLAAMQNAMLKEAEKAFDKLADIATQWIGKALGMSLTGSSGGGAGSILGTAANDNSLLGSIIKLPMAAASKAVSGVSQAVSGSMETYRNAIASIESAGSGGYSALGPIHKTMGQALGRYQIMEANLPSWSKAALGRTVSRPEFMNSPQIQDSIFDHQFGSYVSKYGESGAASMWFTGRPSAPNAKDVLGTSGSSYVEQFNAQVKNSSGALSNLAASSTKTVGNLDDFGKGLKDGLGNLGEGLSGLWKNLGSFLQSPTGGGSSWFQGLSSAFGGVGGAFGHMLSISPLATQGIINAGGGFFGLFDSGGYTGHGGKFDPAGIVHRGEYVFSSEATRAIGATKLDRIHNAAKRGFADGGYAGVSGDFGGAAVSSGPQDIVIRGVFVDDNGVIKAQVTQMGKQAAQAGAKAGVDTVKSNFHNMMADTQSRYV